MALPTPEDAEEGGVDMLSSVSSVEEKVQFRQYVSMPVLSMSVLSRLV